MRGLDLDPKSISHHNELDRVPAEAMSLPVFTLFPPDQTRPFKTPNGPESFSSLGHVTQSIHLYSRFSKLIRLTEANGTYLSRGLCRVCYISGPGVTAGLGPNVKPGAVLFAPPPSRRPEAAAHKRADKRWRSIPGLFRDTNASGHFRDITTQPRDDRLAC